MLHHLPCLREQHHPRCCGNGTSSAVLLLVQAEITRFVYLPMALVDCAQSLLDEVVTNEIHHALEPMMDAYPKACEGAVKVLLQQQDALRAWACPNWFARGHAAMSAGISAFEEVYKKQIALATSLLRGLQHEAGPEQPDHIEELAVQAVMSVMRRQLKALQQQEAALSGGRGCVRAWPQQRCCMMNPPIW